MAIPTPHDQTGRMAVILTLTDAYSLHRQELRMAIKQHQKEGGQTFANRWRNIARLVSRSRRAIIYVEQEMGFKPLRSCYHYAEKPKAKPQHIIVPDPMLSDPWNQADPF